MRANLTVSHALAWTPPVTGSLVQDRSRVERVLVCYKALLETSQRLNRTNDFHELLQVVLGKTLEISRADSSVMFLTDESGGFQFIGGRGSNHKALNEGDVLLSPAVVDRLFRAQDIVCIRDVGHDPASQNDMDLAAQY